MDGPGRLQLLAATTRGLALLKYAVQGQTGLRVALSLVLHASAAVRQLGYHLLAQGAYLEGECAAYRGDITMTFCAPGCVYCGVSRARRAGDSGHSHSRAVAVPGRA